MENKKIAASIHPTYKLTVLKSDRKRENFSASVFRKIRPAKASTITQKNTPQNQLLAAMINLTFRKRICPVHP